MPLEPLNALGSTYDSINAGVHRRTASMVGVPSVVRHVGFWATDESAKDRGGAFSKYVENLVAILKAGDGSTIALDAADLPRCDSAAEIRSGTIHLVRFWWRGMQAAIRIEFRAEYVMVTSILDLSIVPHAGYAATGKDDPQAEAQTRLESLADLFDADPPAPIQAPPESEAQGSSPPETVRSYRSEHFEIARFLHCDLWAQFEREVLNADHEGQAILGRNLGQVFADFRGVVTGSTAGSKDNRLQLEFRRPFKLQPRGQRNRPLQHKSPPSGWARDALRRLWPLIEPHEYLRDHEFTVSGFLNGRALFATALGPKMSDETRTNWDACNQWQWTPVCNVIHAYTDDEWQLGRLVDRIMNLGTLRLAATVEIERLLDVGTKVDELTDAIHDADQAIQDEVEHRKSSNAGQLAGADQAMVNVRNALRDINTAVSNDIFYRLERAEYYIDQFTKGAGSLRVKRIEGFQKYDEIVARRMSTLFGYVRLLRTRMLDVDARMSALSRAYAALKTVKTDEEIEKIQEFGEIALIGVLIPYYLGVGLLYYAFGLHGAPAVLPWQILISFFSAVVMIRIMWRTHKVGLKPNAVGIFLFFAVYLLLTWLVVPAYKHDQPAQSNEAVANHG